MIRPTAPLTSCGLFFHLFFVVQLSSPHNPCHSIVRITYIVYRLIAHVYVLFVVLYIRPSPIDYHDHLRSTIRVISLYRLKVDT